MSKKIGNKLKIFIVEDDAIQAQIIEDNILNFNKNVKLSKFLSGEELFAYLKNYKKENKTHYLILDYFLQTEDNKEGMNGGEVIKHLIDNFAYIKVILFSAYESDDNLKFDALKDENSNLIGVIKKSEFGYKTIQNTIRFDYVGKLFKLKQKRFVMARIALIVVAVFALLYYLLIM